MSYGDPTLQGQARRLRRMLYLDLRRRPWLWALFALSYIPIRLAVEFVR